jgi:hypothetical protein
MCDVSQRTATTLLAMHGESWRKCCIISGAPYMYTCVHIYTCAKENKHTKKNFIIFRNEAHLHLNKVHRILRYYRLAGRYMGGWDGKLCSYSEWPKLVELFVYWIGSPP